MNLFDASLVRYATSGTLILVYSLVDAAARKSCGDAVRARVRMPRRLAPIVFLSVLAFYLTIAPMGRSLLGGAGNLAGIVLALGAALLRWRTRAGSSRVRQPDVAARMLFYAALPLAVGSMAGWLVLTAPALLLSAWWAVREDRLLLAQLGDAWAARMASSRRWIPGVW